MTTDSKKTLLKFLICFFVYFVIAGGVLYLLHSKESIIYMLIETMIIALIGAGIYTIQHRRNDGFEK